MRRLAICLAMLISVQALAQPAAKTATHVVKPGDTLNELARIYLGDSSRWPEIHRLNPQLANPNALTPGQQIRIPLDIRAGSATVAELARRVEKKPEPRPWVAAEKGDTLREKDGIRTFSESSARLTFEDGADLILSEDSLVFLQAIERKRSGRGRDVIEIVDGQADIRSRSRRQSNPEIEVIIGTSTVRPSARDGKLETRGRVTPENTAQVMAYGGDTAVEAGGASVAVAQGMGTFVEEGRPPAPPEKLLPAPVLESPSAGAALDRVALTWSPVPQAANYTVEVCRDVVCNELISRTTEISGTAHRVDLTDLGPAFWRVTATSANGLDGYPSQARLLKKIAVAGGRLLHDRDGDGVLNGATPLAGTVLLFRDENSSIGSGPIATTSAGADGMYRFEIEQPGRYWIAVDSRKLRSSSADERVWMEQTYGPAGSVCAAREGVAGTAAGPCHGGRRAAVPDAVESADGAEHLAAIEIVSESIEDLDFGFSENVVVHVEDDAGAEQGSLRRFVENANRLAGGNAMRFVPVVPANAGQGTWWSIELAESLPAISDAGTVIDGHAWSEDGEPIATNRTTLGRRGAGEPALIDAPELEVEHRSSDEALLKLEAPTIIRDIALTGASPLVTLSADGSELHRVLLGVKPDGSLERAAGGLALILATSSTRYRMSDSLFSGAREPFSVARAVPTSSEEDCGSGGTVLPPRLLALEWKLGTLRVRGETCSRNSILPFFEIDGILVPLAAVTPEGDGSFEVQFDDVAPLQPLGFVAVAPSGVMSPMARREPARQNVR